MRTSIIILGLLALPFAASARPITFADSWMLMSMNDHSEYSLMAIYSPTAQYSVGGRSEYLRDEDAWLHSATYNRLLYRANMPDAQANVFLLTGIGAAENHGDTDPAAYAGIEADWENRRFYVLYENRVIGSEALEESFSQKARFGVAPYIGDYDEIHTWLMIQIDHHPQQSDKIVITPFVRMFNTIVLGELGVSDEGDAMFNLTYQM